MGNVLKASDFAFVLSNGYVRKRVLPVHQQVLQQQTDPIYFMTPTTFADLLFGFNIPNFEMRKNIAWAVNITQSTGQVYCMALQMEVTSTTSTVGELWSNRGNTLKFLSTLISTRSVTSLTNLAHD